MNMRQNETGLRLGVDIDAVKGFLDPAEGRALHDMAREMSRRGPGLEIGSYCGKSAVYLGTACRENGALLFCVDHHRGSEENQRGELYHDPDLYDAEVGAMDSLPAFRRTLRQAGLEDTVIALVAPSAMAARHWTTPLSFVFIDGGHSMAAALGDYRGWAGHVMAGGVLAIHDVFPNPADGGRPPYEIYKLALMSGLFAEIALVKSLALLRRLRHPDVEK